VLSYYRQLGREHGVLVTTRFYLRVAGARIRHRLDNALPGVRVECPCCGWRGRSFRDYVDLGYRVAASVCPRCESHSRHRALSLWLRDPDIARRCRGRALVFAPEKCLEGSWTELPEARVIRLDLEPSRGVDFLADICALPLASGSADFVSCHHVLEHVHDDRGALRELFRVLAPGRSMLLSVPMSADPATREYGRPDPLESGHWRSYGDDFRARLADAGFALRPLVPFPPPVALRHGIRPEPVFLCEKP
jgi:SAM-dependent methyltransferase